MDETLVVQILFAAATVVAALAAFAKSKAKAFRDKVEPIALAVALAAAAFFVQVSDFLS